MVKVATVHVWSEDIKSLIIALKKEDYLVFLFYGNDDEDECIAFCDEVNMTHRNNLSIVPIQISLKTLHSIYDDIIMKYGTPLITIRGISR